jgi:hypothetical protein
MSEPPAGDREPRHWAEDIFIILCIASLWPSIVGWTDPIYEFFLYGAVIGLLGIFVRRVRRLRQARDDLHGD